MTDTVKIIGTASMKQRDQLINSLEWEVREPSLLLRGTLEDSDKETVYLYFGSLTKIAEENYRIDFTAKPDGKDMTLTSAKASKAELMKAFVTMVKTGCVAGVIDKKPKQPRVIMNG